MTNPAFPSRPGASGRALPAPHFPQEQPEAIADARAMLTWLAPAPVERRARGLGAFRDFIPVRASCPRAQGPCLRDGHPRETVRRRGLRDDRVFRLYLGVTGERAPQ